MILSLYESSVTFQLLTVDFSLHRKYHKEHLLYFDTTKSVINHQMRHLEIFPNGNILMIHTKF